MCGKENQVRAASQSLTLWVLRNSTCLTPPSEGFVITSGLRQSGGRQPQGHTAAIALGLSPVHPFQLQGPTQGALGTLLPQSVPETNTRPVEGSGTFQL